MNPDYNMPLRHAAIPCEMVADCLDLAYREVRTSAGMLYPTPGWRAEATPGGIRVVR
jgi:hypothetical protein